MELARALPHPPGSAAELVLRAAAPWSPSTHHLFPAAARARVPFVIWLGRELARELRMESAGALADVWEPFVLPHAVGRDEA